MQIQKRVDLDSDATLASSTRNRFEMFSRRHNTVTLEFAIFLKPCSHMVASSSFCVCLFLLHYVRKKYVCYSRLLNHSCDGEPWRIIMLVMLTQLTAVAASTCKFLIKMSWQLESRRGKRVLCINSSLWLTFQLRSLLKSLLIQEHCL